MFFKKRKSIVDNKVESLVTAVNNMDICTDLTEMIIQYNTALDSLNELKKLVDSKNRKIIEKMVPTSTCGAAYKEFITSGNAQKSIRISPDKLIIGQNPVYMPHNIDKNVSYKLCINSTISIKSVKVNYDGIMIEIGSIKNIGDNIVFNNLQISKDGCVCSFDVLDINKLKADYMFRFNDKPKVVNILGGISTSNLKPYVSRIKSEILEFNDNVFETLSELCEVIRHEIEEFN